MRLKTLLLTTAMVALTATFASAELVASLHINTNDDTNNVDRLAGFRTRTGNGNANTRGTVQGDFSLLSSVDLGVGGYSGADVLTYSGSTRVKELNRYGGNVNGGIAVWDYDVSGMVTNAWELKVDYDSRRSNCLESELYVSFNGLGRSLDTTVVTNLSTGSGVSLVSDLTKYVKIGELPANAATGTYAWDLTDIVNAAATNGGGIRLVYWDNTYMDTGPSFLNDSGLSAGDSTTGSVVNLDNFYLAETFDSASGDLPINGWTESGPEPKQYNNPTNEPGILHVLDLDQEEKGVGTEHAGYWDGVEFLLENGISLPESNDWLQLQLDLGIYYETGVAIKEGRGVRVTFTDANAPSNAGYGFNIQTGTNSNTTLVHEFNGASSYGDSLDNIEYAHPYDGSMDPLVLKVTKVAGGHDVEAMWGGVSIDKTTVSDSLATVFDRLTITATSRDVGLKIDNVYLISNVDPVILTPFEEWAVNSGLEIGVNDDPANNPDSDIYDNWGEYVLGGDPTNGMDIGIQPEFNMASTGYVYSVRNDTALTVSILTSDDLVNSSWTTNAGETIVADDGGITEYTYSVDATNAQEFIKLIVE